MFKKERRTRTGGGVDHGENAGTEPQQLEITVQSSLQPV